ncbi:MAG TPA: hypothetical protein VLA82_03660 [Actinomycetota bacterium]|nr:hypothetical protein [Actinomycetota bacterium]
MDASGDDTRCPICGVGVVRDVVYDEGAERGDGAPMQTADTHQVTTYTCGHSVDGATLATADTGKLDVEERSSEDTIDPPDSMG